VRPNPRCEALTHDLLRCIRNGRFEIGGRWLCRQHATFTIEQDFQDSINAIRRAITQEEERK